MSLILAKLAQAISAGPLDRQRFELEQKMQDLAAQRQKSLIQQQQNFQAGQNEQDRALRSEEINRLREQFEQQFSLQERSLQADVTSSKAANRRSEEQLNLQRQQFKADTARNQQLDELTQAQIGLIGAQTDQLVRGIPDYVRTLPDDFLAGLDALTARQFLSDPRQTSITHPRDIAIMSTIVSTGKNPMTDSVDAGDAALAIQRMTQTFWEQALLEQGLNPNTDTLTLQAQPELLNAVVQRTNALLQQSTAVNELSKLTGHPVDSIVGGPVTVGTIQEALGSQNRGMTMGFAGQVQEGSGTVSASDNPRIAQATNEVFALAFERAQTEGFDKVITDLETLHQHLTTTGVGPALGPLKSAFGSITDANLFEVINALKQKQMEQQMMMMQMQMGGPMQVQGIQQQR